MSNISWQEFENCGIMAGTVIRIEDFPKAKKPAYKLWIDFGPHGIKQSSAQLTALYKNEDLINKQVICVTGFPKKKIADFESEVLTTGFVLENSDVVLAVPEKIVPNGSKLA